MGKAKNGRRAKQLSNFEVLERRRDFLEQQIAADAPQPSAWDKRELEALNWAIGQLVEEQ